MTRIIRYIFCTFLAGLFLISCERDPLAEVHNSIDALDVKSIEDQVEAMRATMQLIQELEEKVPPILEGLEQAQANLFSSLDEIKAQAAGSDSTSLELQASIISLQAQLDATKAAYDALAALNLQGRYDELEQFVSSSLGSLDARVELLEAAQQAYATLDQIAALQTAVDALPGNFEENFRKSIEGCRDLIISWVAESNELKSLFSDYYTKSQFQFEVSVVGNTDVAQEEIIGSFNERLDGVDSDIRSTIEKLFGEVKIDIESESVRIHGELDSIGRDLDRLTSRIEALEKLYGVIGDYSEYKSNLIDDIKAIQDKVLDEGTLTALVNTLKQLLVEGEDQYFDLKAIVARISAQKDSVSVHSVQLNTLDSLVRTLATIEALNSLNDDVTGLRNDMLGNKGDIATLVQRVDAIVSKWTDTIYDTIGANSEEIQKLREADLAIWEALGDTSTKDTGIYKLIADINTAIANWQIGDMRDSLTRINALLANCGIGEIKGLQANLEDLDARIAAIWTAIGNETLAISGSIINAINVLNSRFGDLGNTTIEAIIAGLESDLAIIRGAGWDADSISLADLARICAKLKTDIGAKTDTSVVKDLKATVSEIQQAIVGIITEANADEKLAAYLKKTAADTLYATIENYDKFLGTYKKIVGEEADPAPGTVLYQIKFLGTLMGSGTFDSNWTTDLTTAVNRLHALVGQDSVSRQATDITNGLLQDLVNSILGGSGNVKDIADSLVSFRNNVDTLYKYLGDTAKFHGGNSDIASALACIWELVDDLGNQYAAIKHTHTSSQITDFTSEVNKLIKEITGELKDLKTSAKDNLVAAINELYDAFGGYDIKGDVDSLLTALELKLVEAVLNGDSNAFKDLNLSAIRRGIDDIIEGKTGILDHWIDSVITELYKNSLDNFVQDGWLADSNYINHKQVDTSVISALAALSGAFEKWGGWSFTYATLDSAIAMVCDSLKQYIVNQDNAIASLNALKDRVGLIEDAIGGAGIFDASRTVADVTDSLIQLFGNLGAGSNVRELVNGLSSIDTLLINALLGKASGGTIEDFKQLNLQILKDRLDTLGFDDIHTGGRSLVTALQEIADGISQLARTIGTGFDESHTVADAAKAIVDSLGNFSDSLYQKEREELLGWMTDLVDALGGKKGSTLANVAELKRTIDNINVIVQEMLDKRSVQIKESLALINSRIDSLCAIIGDTTGKGTGSVIQLLIELRDKIEKYQISYDDITRQFFDAGIDASVLKINTGMFDRKLIIFWELNTDNVKTTSKVLVGAVNELLDKLAAIEITQTSFIHPEDIRALGDSLIGGTGLVYDSFDTLSKVIMRYAGYLGESSDYDEEDIWSAIRALEGLEKALLDAIGIVPEGTSFNGVWDAIVQLSASLQRTVGSQINAITFIPEYDDGMATVNSDGNGHFGDLEMNFKVSAKYMFFKTYGGKEQDIKGLVKRFPAPEGEPSSSEGKEIPGKAVIKGDVLTATFYQEDISNYLKNADRVYVAVALCSASGREYVSEYVPLYIDSNGKVKRLRTSSPAPGDTIWFAKGLGGSRKIVLTPVFEDDNLAGIESVCSINHISMSGSQRERTVKASTYVTMDDTGTVSIKDALQQYDYIIRIADPSTDWTLSGNGVSRNESNNTISIERGEKALITFSLSEWNASGTLSATIEKKGGGTKPNWLYDPVINGDTIVVNTHSSQALPNDATLIVKFDGTEIARITLHSTR